MALCPAVEAFEAVYVQAGCYHCISGWELTDCAFGIACSSWIAERQVEFVKLRLRGHIGDCGVSWTFGSDGSSKEVLNGPGLVYSPKTCCAARRSLTAGIAVTVGRDCLTYQRFKARLLLYVGLREL